LICYHDLVENRVNVQHIYYCPICKSKIAFGAKSCVDCGTPFDWQQFKPPAYSTQPPQYQEQVPPQPEQQQPGQVEQYIQPQTGKRILAPGLRVIGLIILGGIVWSLLGGGPTAPSASPSPVTITITAVQLWVDFDSDQDAANAKYRGKVINVTGIVNEIGIDRVDTPYVLLTSADGLFGVQCLFSSKDELRSAQLSQGQTLTIQGICHGYDLDVVLKNCSIK
jgi:hypothetical protein